MLKRSLWIAALSVLALHGQQPTFVVSIPDAGAAGDGLVDDASAIQKAIDDSPESSTIDFGEGKTYRIGRTVRLQPNRIYRGASAIVMSTTAVPGSPMLVLSYGQSQSVILDGLTLDARQVGGILQLAVGGGVDIPATGIVVRNCSMLNNGGGGQVSESAIYTPVGLQSSIISNNRFVNCSTCIHIANPAQVSIANNDFDTTRGGNAISVVTYNYGPVYGDGLEITGNRARNLKRMGVELLGGQPNTRMNSPLIADNVFTDWQADLADDPYGISVAVGISARILRNTLSGRQGGYGIEVGARGSLVSENIVTGFFYGIVIQGQSDVVLKSNTISDQIESGILFSNAGPNPRAQISGNRISNPRKFGIGMSPNDYGGADIQGNTIEREGGRYGTDSASETFIGIKMDSGPASPVTVSGNRIVQTAAVPPQRFDFIGIGFFGGYPGSTFQENTVESKSSAPLGTGLLFWFSPYAEGSSVTQNKFVNLTRVTNGFTSPRVHAVGNQASRVPQNDPNIVKPPVRKSQ